MRALLVTNRASGSSAVDLATPLALLQEHGIEVLRVAPANPDDVAATIMRYADEVAMTIVGGGDGTLNCAAPALLDVGKPFAVFPMGTANDFARTLEIPTDPTDAARIICQGRKRRIDLGVVNGRPFFNVASLGLSSEIARYHRGERKRRLKLMSYPLSWIDAYRSHRPLKVALDIDGKRHKIRCTQLAVGNGKHYGGGLTVSEESDIDDGLLTLYYIKSAGLWDLLALLPALKLGTLAKERNAELYRGKSIELRTRKPQRINVDGELVASTPAKFSVLPAALEVFCPGPGGHPLLGSWFGGVDDAPVA